MHDWMHLMCVGGIVQTTVYLFLETVSSSTGMNLYKMIAGYMALWVLPKSKPWVWNICSARDLTSRMIVFADHCPTKRDARAYNVVGDLRLICPELEVVDCWLDPIFLGRLNPTELNLAVDISDKLWVPRSNMNETIEDQIFICFFSIVRVKLCQTSLES